MSLTRYRIPDRDENEKIRRMNEEYDRIHGPARVIPIPPEARAPVAPAPGGTPRPWPRYSLTRKGYRP